MSATVISLDSFRRNRIFDPPDRSFDAIFRDAHHLRDFGPEVIPGEIAVMTWCEIQNWFQKEIANEVFRKHIFERGVLLSIGFVSELLTDFARNAQPIGIMEYVNGYSRSENPGDILKAANTAFLMFSFWPEMRVRRQVRYRKMALSLGPSLYMWYAELTRKTFGYSMAKAFEPLGTITRERFHHHK